MKKWIVLFALLIMLVFATSAMAADSWKTANQITIAWDAVTTLGDGSALPAGNVIKYDVYFRLDGHTDAGTKATPVPISVTSSIVTFSTEGKYRLGVATLRYDSLGALLATSETAWSDVAASCQGGATFGVVFYLAPAKAGGLRVP